MYQMVIVRHGESEWNRSNRFTGWTDIDLSPTGLAEAHRAGAALQRQGWSFDLACTSMLKRAVRTLWAILDEMDLMWIPVRHSWRLNERHYGALQGLNKREVSERMGAENVRRIRRSYDLRPPALSPDDPRYPGRDPRYGDLTPEELPCAESLADTVARLLPYWQEEIAPAIRSGRKVIIVAHGNSLRGLEEYLDDLTPKEVVDLEIPTGIPIVYELNEQMKKIRHYYLETTS